MMVDEMTSGGMIINGVASVRMLIDVMATGGMMIGGMAII
jgi:hypothetical protein